jgi:trehalose 6-phosphate phosphatase
MDIDGTISATAPTVAAATLLPGVRDLLGQAAAAFDLVATVSGRAVADQRRMIDVPGVWHVGHHGYEWEKLDGETGEHHEVLLPEAAPYLEPMARALDESEAELAPLIPGLWMERKGITSGVHWRLSADSEAARAICVPTVARIAERHGLRMRESKLAVELFPPVTTDKGAGLLRLIETHQLRGVIYLGDDVSDTDAFLMLRERRRWGRGSGISIGVFHADAPEELMATSDILVDSTEEVPGVIEWMLRMRA